MKMIDSLLHTKLEIFSLKFSEKVDSNHFIRKFELMDSVSFSYGNLIPFEYFYRGA